MGGHLETSPSPGRPKLQGGNAWHAWVAPLAPDGEWVDVDPTNGQPADAASVVPVIGRDTCIPPAKGVILIESTGSTMAVDVTRSGTQPVDGRG